MASELPAFSDLVPTATCLGAVATTPSSRSRGMIILAILSEE